MKKLLIIFIFISCSMFSQKHGTCRVTKVSKDTKTKITFRFLTPLGKPATSHLAFKINNDSIVQPKIDKKTGIYVMVLKPGTYEFNFFVKFWYEINSSPIKLKPNTNTMVVVKFEAKEIGAASVN